MRTGVAIATILFAALGLAGIARAQGTSAAPALSALSDPVAMERDRRRSQALSPAERERALRVFDQAFSLYQGGDFGSAKIGFERGLGIDPGNGDANFYLGELLTRQGDRKGARARFQRSVFFDPDSAAGLKAKFALEQQSAGMVAVPAGEFWMGNDQGDPAEKPRHLVDLDIFYIDSLPVTNRQYRQCVQSGTCREPEWGQPNYGVEFTGPIRSWDEDMLKLLKRHYASLELREVDHPVVGVSWHDAETYCRWVGKRLPTDAEWEKFARGATFSGVIWKGHKYPPGSFVREWVSDWYAADYYKRSPKHNPQGPGSGRDRVVRFGPLDRGSYRPDTRNSAFSFRCAEGAQ
jgi:formylglycine-generating enzyme required for sulfatase activity